MRFFVTIEFAVHGFNTYITFSPTVKYILVRRLLRSRKPRNVHVVYRCFRLIFVARIINTYGPEYRSPIRIRLESFERPAPFFLSTIFLDGTGFWPPDVLPVRRGFPFGISSYACTSTRVPTDFLDVRPDGR